MHDTINKAASEVLDAASPNVSDERFEKIAYLAAFETAAYGMYPLIPYIFKAILTRYLPNLEQAGLNFRTVKLPAYILARDPHNIGRLTSEEVAMLLSSMEELKAMAKQETCFLLVSGRMSATLSREVHAVTMAVDFEAREFVFHDSAGKILTTQTLNVIKKVFHDFDVRCLELRQQGINFSCALHSVINLISLARGDGLKVISRETLYDFRCETIPIVLQAVYEHCKEKLATLAEFNSLTNKGTYASVIEAIEHSDGDMVLHGSFAFVTTLIRLEQGKPFKAHSVDLSVTPDGHYRRHFGRYVNEFVQFGLEPEIMATSSAQQINPVRERLLFDASQSPYAFKA